MDMFVLTIMPANTGVSSRVHVGLLVLCIVQIQVGG